MHGASLHNYKAVVIQDNSMDVLFNGLLAEFRAVFDSFLPIPQVITRGGWWGALVVAD